MYQKKVLGGKMPSIKLRKGQSVVRSVKGAPAVSVIPLILSMVNLSLKKIAPVNK
tara:strand:- start:541 stop:705 length:165 start_codon:yes stop_codon:yes gene_type:complete